MAVRNIRERGRKFSDNEMLDKLRQLHERQGWLSGILIDEADSMPSSSAYAHRFGSLIRAYELIGYTPDRDYRYIEINRHLRQMYAGIVEDTIRKIKDLGGHVRREIAQIITLKLLTTHTKATDKYKQILASIKEVGIIEPPVVTHSTQGRNRYMLLDGHMRLEALRELGETEVICIVAEDDESFTYNKHVNRLSAIQEHKMILLAVERGVPEEKIAKALNLDVTSIVRRRNLLEGIAPEVAEPR